jgi:hypothetical protein
MSSDAEAVLGPEPGNVLIEQVTEGMSVVDSAGQRVGKVTFVEMGDPLALTSEGNRMPAPDPLTELGMAVTGDAREPVVPEPVRSKLLHYGFLRVDGTGLFHKDYYVRSNQIAGVRGDTVTLAVTKDELIEARGRA